MSSIRDPCMIQSRSVPEFELVLLSGASLAQPALALFGALWSL